MVSAGLEFSGLEAPLKDEWPLLPSPGKGFHSMLVLSRRLHEKVVLPTLGITLQVVAIRPGVVRLGIEAPADVPVFREELLLVPAEVESLP
jgi:carbon storage regulator